MVVERQLAARLGIGGQHGREGLADRAQFEQRVLAHWPGRRCGGQAIVEEQGLAVDRDGHRHPGHTMLFHQRLHGAVDDAANGGGVRRGCCGGGKDT